MCVCECICVSCASECIFLGGVGFYSMEKICFAEILEAMNFLRFL